MKVIANGISIEVEDSHHGQGADAGRPAVLLIMGLGMQLVAWPQPMVQALVDAGYRVVRFDNRDIGLSQHFDSLGVPNVLWQGLKYRMGLSIVASYSLQDMAADALGVLDALGMAQAHVVGVSMGGMIAQRMALLAPQRVRSLTSIMSSSSARGLPGSRPEVTRALLSRPAGKSREAVVEHTLQLFKIIGSKGPSPGFCISDDDLRAQVTLAIGRSYHPQGVARQMVAVAADSPRAALLANIRARTLVVHGKADRLLPFACGEDTARRIPGAVLTGIDDMAHDLPPAAVSRLLALLIPHFTLADQTGATATSATPATPATLNRAT